MGTKKYFVFALGFAFKVVCFYQDVFGINVRNYCLFLVLSCVAKNYVLCLKSCYYEERLNRP